MQGYHVSVIDHKNWLDGNHMIACYDQVFNEVRPRELEKCDFAFVIYKDEKPTSFITCIELDGETLYWQFGGAFDEVKKTIHVALSYKAAIQHAKDMGYKRITTRIENTNFEMLRLAMKYGFLIVGTWNFKGHVFLELLNEFTGGQ